MRKLNLLAGGITLFAAASAGADVILSTDFSNRTVSGATASNLSYTLDGVASPGNLTAVEADLAVVQLAGLFDTAATAGAFAPDLNTDNEDNWRLTVPLTLTVPAITIDNVALDGFMVTNTGGYQSAVRDTDIRLRLVGSVSGTVVDETKSVANAGGGATLAMAQWSVQPTFTFGGSPVLLTDVEGWDLVIETANLAGAGNNTALDSITVNGTVPEPAHAMLAAGSIGLLLRRRRRIAGDMPQVA